VRLTIKGGKQSSKYGSYYTFHPFLFNLVQVYCISCRSHMQLWCTVQVHIFLFCREFNTSGAKVLNIVTYVQLLPNAINLTLKVLTVAAKLRTCRDETWLVSAERSVLKPGSWTRSVDCGTSVMGVIRQQLLWKKGTQVSHHLSSVLYNSFKVNYAIKRFNISLQMKRTFPFEYLVFANNHYVITIFLYG